MSVPPIPPGYHTITPYLLVEDIDALITFLEKAFDARVHDRVTLPDGTLTHTDLTIGNSHLMVGRANDEFPAFPTMLYLYTEDVDAWYARAIEAGGTPMMEPTLQTYGNRDGGVKGPQGNYWWIGTQVEEVSSEELNRREAERRR